MIFIIDRLRMICFGLTCLTVGLIDPQKFLREIYEDLKKQVER